jgi:hypothetical protein
MEGGFIWNGCLGGYFLGLSRRLSFLQFSSYLLNIDKVLIMPKSLLPKDLLNRKPE